MIDLQRIIPEEKLPRQNPDRQKVTARKCGKGDRKNREYGIMCLFQERLQLESFFLYTTV